MTDEIWITQNGQEILVGDMAEDHAKNVLRRMLQAIRERASDREMGKMLSSLANKNMKEGRFDKSED